MPVYAYFCRANGRTVEVFHSMKEDLGSWAEVCERAENLLLGGFDVVVDGAFKRQAEREPVIELAERAGARLLFLRTTCRVDEQRRRLEKRQQHDTRSDGRVELMEHQRADFEGPDAEHPVLFASVATDGPKPETRTRVDELLWAKGLLREPAQAELE